MGSVSVISLSWVDIFFVVLMLVSSALFAYFSIMRYLHNYKVNLLCRVISDIEESYKRKIVTAPISLITAEQANKLKQSSVTQTEIDTLLKPVFDKIAKASEKGDSEIFLSDRDWYYNKNEKYKEARQQLERLGYSLWNDNDGFGVWVKW